MLGFIFCVMGFRGKKKKLESVMENSNIVGDVALIMEAISYIDW